MTSKHTTALALAIITAFLTGCLKPPEQVNVNQLNLKSGVLTYEVGIFSKELVPYTGTITHVSDTGETLMNATSVDGKIKTLETWYPSGNKRIVIDTNKTIAMPELSHEPWEIFVKDAPYLSEFKAYDKDEVLILEKADNSLSGSMAQGIPYIKYYTNNNIAEEGFVQDGQIAGPFKKYAENGKLAMEGYSYKGNPEGIIKIYDNNGELLSQDFLMSSIGLKLIHIPAQSGHDEYWIAEHETTQAAWESILGSNPSKNYSSKQLPVEQVSYKDIMKFTTDLNELYKGLGVLPRGYTMTLPTKEQWLEMAHLEDGVNSIAWYLENSKGNSHKVGTKKPNQYGVYDIHGNLWEWILSSSKNDAEYIGGGWNSDPESLNEKAAMKSGQNFRIHHLGFRLALSQ